MSIIVCPLSFVETVCERRRPSHLISLLDPGHVEVIPTPGGLGAAAHLRLGVHDIAEEIEGYICPDETLVEQLVAFGRGWKGQAPIVIHCWAGISRSTASAYALACERNPDASAHEIAEAIRRASPYAYPNRRIVALADDLLGRRGRMVDAVERIGRGEVIVESVPFEFAADWRA
jgi:predicted protein tyrosine phosphatase